MPLPSLTFQPLLGKDCAVTLTPLTIAADGSMTAGTPVSFAARFEDYSLEIDPQMEEISPSDASGANWVKLIDDTSFSLTEIMTKPRASNPSSALATAVVAGSYFSYTIAHGTETWVGYAIRGRFGYRGQGKGRRTAECTFRQILVSSSNPILTAFS